MGRAGRLKTFTVIGFVILRRSATLKTHHAVIAPLGFELRQTDQRFIGGSEAGECERLAFWLGIVAMMTRLLTLERGQG
jgi:hypothetical protein